MGTIHDRLKARAQRLHTVTIDRRVPPGIKPDTARRMSVFLQSLDATRSSRLDTAARHHTMQRLADEAEKLGLKGRWNLLCNRTQCLRPPALWYNRGSYAFYCDDCARDLNRVNRHDAEELLGAGQKLCIEITTGAQAETLHVSP
jgi:hypothetical protein